MFIKNQEEFDKCCKLDIGVVTNRIICMGMAKMVGMPDLQTIIKVRTDQKEQVAVMGQGYIKNTDQYFVVGSAIVNGKALYEALIVNKIKTVGLGAYCFVQELIEELKGSVEKYGHISGHKSGAELAEHLNEHLPKEMLISED